MTIEDRPLSSDALALLGAGRRDAPPAGSLDRELRRLGLAEKAGPGGADHPMGGALGIKVGTALFVALAGALALTVPSTNSGSPGNAAVRSKATGDALPPENPIAAALPSAPAAPSGDLPRVDAQDLPNADGANGLRPSTVGAGRRAARAPGLAEEVRLVDRARALSRSDVRAALGVLDEHRRRFPEGALRDEADVARIEALVAAGRAAEARAVRDALIARHPAEPIARRADALLGSR